MIDLLLTERKTTYEGEYYQLKEAYCEPKPARTPRPPFVIGGKGEKRLLRSAAMWADHYNHPGADLVDFKYRLEVLERWCASWAGTGRDRDLAAAEAGDAGADHVVFMLPPPHEVGTLERLAVATESLVA